MEAILDRSPDLAELNVSYKHTSTIRKSVKGPPDVIDYLRAVWDENTLELREDFYMLCLDGAHQITGWIRLFSGGISGCTVDPRIAFSTALQAAAASVIFAHNHPSGSCLASEDDRKVAKRLNECGELLGIKVLDHIILTKNGHNHFTDTRWR